MKVNTKRCDWVNMNSELYVRYHDQEWGVPKYNDRELFEMLILEGAQAGLSWEMILNKRENYREAFDDFDPEKVAQYDTKKYDELLQNSGIVRNRLKIKSAIQNAKIFLDIKKEQGSFSNYIWGFVDHKPIINRWEEHSEIPVNTTLSDTISKDMKKRGMSFVGSTIGTVKKSVSA